ncbi:stage III sporulation protein AG [Ruminococcus albus]|uniref:Stage III sporulation protein AG n=1 Tax=Ruminococcus albus TaxID=1264 RepID=A0A1H7FKB5_RUMAL|nr:stage III sporulation protein AG [Ruminococcus albus]SEK25687.1 stage III sporulation protein AG [Ruminococcus albus]
MKKLIQQLADRLRNSPNRLKIAVVLGAAGMLMIMLSEFIPDNKDKPEKGVAQTKTSDSNNFRKRTENELKELLEQIEGVGECEVMISLESSTEYVYAENISRFTEDNTDRRSEKLDEDIVITENGGTRQPLIRKVIDPQIGGVVIVCEGGGNISINERVQKAVSTALNISSTRVCVEAKCR